MSPFAGARNLLEPRRPAPLLTPDILSRIVRRHYGIDGSLELLAYERDQVYKLTASDATFVVRISDYRESHGSLLLQNDVLAAVRREDPRLPVPRLVESSSGQDIEQFSAAQRDWRVRVFTYLPGVPILRGPRPVGLLENIGTTLARLNRALVPLRVDHPPFSLLWDIQTAPTLLTYLSTVPLKATRALVAEVLGDFQMNCAPRLRDLARQVIHNDFNPKNVLFRSAFEHDVVGIIDFGDVVLAPRVVDVGVAIARHLELGRILEPAVHIASGYARLSKLSSVEIDILHVIVRVRLAMRILIRYRRLTQCATPLPGDVSAIDETVMLLREVSKVGKERFTAALQSRAVA